MSEEQRDALGERLERATTWEGPETELWSGALASEDAAPPATAHRVSPGLWATPWARAAVLMLAVSAVLVAGAMMVPSRKARSMLSSPSAPVAAPAEPDASGTVAARKLVQGGFSMASETVAPLPSPDTAAERVVIKKATVELEAVDVRGVFAKGAMLVQDGAGEYVEASSLTGGMGSGERREPLHATLTLRVRVERLSEVLNRVRDLGTVTSENIDGEDVTGEAVDLDARLRNEQRVESELLELLTSRKDAPLKEILELREQIARVREQIETLTARRDRLHRLASLATVLVVIREVQPEQEPRGSSLGDRFDGSLARAWRDGMENLIDSLAWIVHVVVSGAFWWIAVAAGAMLTIRGMRGASRAGNRREPVPSAAPAPSPLPSAHDARS